METFKINGIYRGDLHTIEDVAHLIAGASPFDNLMITDIADVKLVSTIGNFLNHVSDKELRFCCKVLNLLSNKVE